MLFHQPNQIFVIARQKLSGLGEHWGVQFTDGSVAHYTAERNLEIVSVEAFAQGRDVRIVRNVPTQLHPEVMQRLRISVFERRPYNATTWNCEIFANWLTGEKPASQQVAVWAVLSVFAGIFWLNAKG